MKIKMAKLGMIVVVSLVATLASLSCQTYTTGVKQSVARANETTAITALRSVALAQQTYSVSNDGKYGTFQQLSDGGFLEPSFNSNNPEVKDYVLTMVVGPKPGGQPQEFFSCNAHPKREGEQAGRHFYIDSTSSQIRVNASQPATAADAPIQP